ncbi:MAG TPA: aromatic-ring-hydroxylating dioxygenase subunit beta [Alphaproteobacteria bacterium]|jgi:3-phenylpropionate/cinnamic acid dioxygenase small subunit
MARKVKAKAKAKPAAKSKPAAKPRTTAAAKPRAAAAHTNGVDTQRAVEQFLYSQAEILDDRRWDDWLALFTPDGRYWMPVTQDQKEWDGVPNIFNEDIHIMEMRARRVVHPRAHSQKPPMRLSHVVSNVVVEKDDPRTGEVVTRAKFYAAEFRRDNVRHFAGSYRHTLKRDGNGGFKIKLQRVDLVNAEGPYEYVLQYWL